MIIDKHYMKQYVFALLPMLLPVPGRFALGLICIIIFNLVLASGCLFQHALHALKMETTQFVLLVPFVVGMSVFAQQLLMIYSPGIALQLGILVHFPALSAFLITILHTVKRDSLIKELSATMVPAGIYSGFAFVFMLFRDIFGYGGISFPVPSGIRELIFFDTAKLPFMQFAATIPGTLIISMLIFVFYSHCRRKMIIIKRAGLTDE